MNDGLNLKDIKAIVFDIDGVLSDGRIIPAGPTANDLIRIVDAKDAFATRAAAAKGFVMGVISGGETDALDSRCRHIGVKKENLFLGARGKLSIFHKFCAQNGLEPREVAYFGDDIPDTQVLRACGLGIAPSDAVEEARRAADYVTLHKGGRGCLREGIEMILKAQDKWRFDEDKFDQIY